MSSRPLDRQARQQARLSDTRGAMNHKRTNPFPIAEHQGLYSREGQLVFGTCQVIVPGMWRGRGNTWVRLFTLNRAALCMGLSHREWGFLKSRPPAGL